MTFSPSISGTNTLINQNIYARSSVSTGYKPETYVLKVDPGHTGPIIRGTVLAMYDTGAGPDVTYDDKVYVYDDTATDGRDVALGVLDNVDIPESSLFTIDGMGAVVPAEVAITVLIPSGGDIELYASRLTGLDAAAAIDLNGMIDTARDIFTF